ncbi:MULTISPECIES: hypothetical protein [Rhodopirellula]|uniref:hypothetical protein n=1 Tax=Rhodopirellula TaxID=265488 RepID=UPI00257F04A7|nr:hypothetical protein [Rhodopirellula sp. UBA1907]MCR9209496.1 hypothetical protein [bacterium]
MPSGWALLQRQQIENLSGCNVHDWRCIEMAFESPDEENPVWRHESVDAMQCAVVDLLIDKVWQRFHTLPGDNPHSSGIVVRDAPGTQELVEANTSIYRNQLSSRLPRGLIQSIETTADSYGTIGCVTMQIGQDIVSLSAGEVYESADGGYRIADFDESVLVRLNDRHPRG